MDEKHKEWLILGGAAASVIGLLYLMRNRSQSSFSVASPGNLGSSTSGQRGSDPSQLTDAAIKYELGLGQIEAQKEVSLASIAANERESVLKAQTAENLAKIGSGNSFRSGLTSGVGNPQNWNALLDKLLRPSSTPTNPFTGFQSGSEELNINPFKDFSGNAEQFDVSLANPSSRFGDVFGQVGDLGFISDQNVSDAGFSIPLETIEPPIFDNYDLSGFTGMEPEGGPE